MCCFVAYFFVLIQNSICLLIYNLQIVKCTVNFGPYSLFDYLQNEVLHLDSNFFNPLTPGRFE